MAVSAVVGVVILISALESLWPGSDFNPRRSEIDKADDPEYLVGPAHLTGFPGVVRIIPKG